MLGDQTHPLMQLWTNGPTIGGVQVPGAFIGDNGKPHSRVTVEPGFWLNLTQGPVGNFSSNKLPIRWWRNLNSPVPNMSDEVEVPNIKSISITRSLDQDASSCTITMYDQSMNPLTFPGFTDVGPGGSASVNWLGEPGSYSPTYMQSAAAKARWGGLTTGWDQILTPNACLRTYQGYGGYTNGIPDPIDRAVANENLVLTGTWLIDDVNVSTDGTISMKCRDMAKLLVDQMVYPPFIPVGLYPLHYCFPPGTLVNMADGSYKPIEQVVAGDEVLTHDGVGKVKRTFEYDYTGELVRVRRSGSSVTVAATPTHGFLATPHKADRNICGGYRFKKIDDSSTWKFVDADDLEEGYWLSAAYPAEEVDFLVDLLSLDEHLQSYFDRGGVERAGIVSTIWKRFLDRDMPRYVEMSEDLAWVLGLWMAEGCFGHKSKYGYPLEIVWNLGSHEQTLANELVERCVRLGVGEPKIQVPSHRPGVFRITLTNAPLAILLRHTCGEYAPLKQASREIMLMPRRFQSCFLSGYRSGDGHVYRQAKRHCQPEQLLDRPVTHDASITASPVLARQLGLLGARVEKCIPRIYEDDHSVVHEGDFSTENSAWHVDSAQRTMRGRRRQRDGYYAAKITGLMREEYQGKIHSFEVDSQHTYVVEDMVVSNSAFFYPSFNNPIPYGPAAGNTRWITKAIAAPASDGYWLAGSDGGVFSFGNAGFHGSLGGNATLIGQTATFAVASPEDLIACDIMRSPTGRGYALVTNTGVIYGYGDWSGPKGTLLPTLNYPITAAAMQPSGKGCWLLSTEGGVFALGTARYYGGGPQKGAISYVDIEPTATGLGYWLLAADGDVYSFGDATYHGGAAANLGGSPATAMSATPSGKGYVIVNALGGVFNFGDSTYYGSIFSDEQAGDFTQLNALITDVIADEAGYRLFALDGGVFTFGDSQFYGSLAGVYLLTEIGNMGNPPDYANVITDILLWAGFYAYPTLNTNGSPAVYGLIEPTGAYPVNSILGGLDPAGQIADDIFNKMPPMNSITKIKEIVGYVFCIREDGSVFFAAPNIYAPGNFLNTGTQTTFIPTVDEALQLTEYTMAMNDQDIRSEIIIGSFEPLANAPGSIAAVYVPKHNLNYLRGMVKPAEWIDQFFVDQAQQQLMAELLALMVWQKLRQGSVTCAALPLLQLDDQIRIMERQSGETYIHHVQSLQTDHDLDQGTYTMQITTNWLGDESNWSINAPQEYTLWSQTVIPNNAGEAIPAPAAPSVLVAGAPGQTKVWYAMTSLTANGESTLGPATEITTSHNPLSAVNFNALSWGSINSASSYNIYKSGDGTSFFLLTNATNTNYNDDGSTTVSGTVPPVVNTALTLGASAPHTVTCYTNNLLTGSPTLSGSGGSVQVGSVLVVDTALNREVVVVTATNPGVGTFTANFTLAHQGIYPIVGVVNDTNPADFLP